ncbi:MAG: TlpA family protein disulfide reductase [Acidobacteria bacterium]|nr:TlpA family protein disulfide reductase [Acidobacteriota bacterium]
MGGIATAGINVKEAAQRKKAPEFELKDIEGNTVRLSDSAGKVVLIAFWATWCGPCRAETPWLIELSERYRSEGLVVLGISMDEEWGPIKAFVRKMGVTYPILKGTARATYLYGDVDSLPVAFFVDRQQKVAAIHSGAANRKQFEQTIKTLLAAE